jgi:hypothetical protein
MGVELRWRNRSRLPAGRQWLVRHKECENRLLGGNKSDQSNADYDKLATRVHARTPQKMLGNSMPASGMATAPPRTTLSSF